MSLTRAEWLEMWESIKKIEKAAQPADTRWEARILLEVDKIKAKIQRAIGEME